MASTITGTGSFGAFTLTVTPEALRAKSVDIETQIKQLSELLEGVYTQSRNTEGFWIGDGGDANRELFELARPEIDEIISRYTEHNHSLRVIASRYTLIEKINESQVESLPASPLN